MTHFYESDLDGLIEAPEPLVRAILVKLCEESHIRARALQYLDNLLHFESQGVTTTVSSANASTSPVPGNPRKRRKTGDPKICVQCETIFVDDENNRNACRYHSGECLARTPTAISVVYEMINTFECFQT